ncbi:MAG TPA: hypothetical protein DHV28_17705 [Ignavibacteriales bacterium]|nr:hypothetical protein [Ignavibacteriales bacterium]
MKTKILDDPLKDAELTMNILQLFAKYGLVNDIALRNSIIRKNYQGSKARGERIYDFIIKTAEEYSLSEKSVNAIIYCTQKHKNNSKGNNGNEF